MLYRYFLSSLRLITILLLFSGNVLAKTEVSVEIIGANIDATYERNIRLFLSIEQQRNSATLSDTQIRRLHRLAGREIRAALEPFGYYNPQIESELVSDVEQRWRAIYRIETGEPVIIDDNGFSLLGEATGDAAFEVYLAANALDEGRRFSHVEYESFKSGLIDLANERGYFQARFVQQRVEIDRQLNTASINLEFNSGPRYRFGDLNVAGSPIDESLVLEYASFSSGDFYELDLLLEFQQALSDTRYFDSVEVSPGQQQTDGTRVPVVVQLTPRSRHLFRVGLGYGTDTGARTRFGWEIPRINEQGHRFDSELKVSEIGYELFANYRIPVFNPRTDLWSFSASEEGERFESGLSTKQTLGSSLSHGRGDWRETLSLEYELEDYAIDGDDFDSELLIPGVSWSRTWGSDFIDVLQGLRLDFSVRAANQSIVSDIDFSKTRAAIKFITPLSPRNRIIMRGSLGAIVTDDINEVPSSLRFYAGGATSVRGYAYNSLGPADDDGDAIGASNVMTGSIEYEHFFSDFWGFALFWDGGNAIEDFDEKLEQGAGFGFRWKSPIGLVRIDLANAITVDNGWRLHLNIGPDL